VSLEHELQAAQAQHRAGRRDEAIAAYRDIIARAPGLAEAHNNLGNGLCEVGRLDEAIAAFEQASWLRPHAAQPHNNRGVALSRAGRRDETLAAFRHAIALDGNYASAHNNLGENFRQAGRLDEAAAALERAIALRPDYADAYNNLGNVLRDQGRLDLALAAFDRAVLVQPDHVRAASNRLFTLHGHPGFDAPAILEEHRRWARRYAAPLAAEIRPHPNPLPLGEGGRRPGEGRRDSERLGQGEGGRRPGEGPRVTSSPGRPLRIGYVSPDFRGHAVGQMMLAILAHHDRRQVETVAYSDVQAPDALTVELRRRADVWRDAAGLTDSQLAALIRADRIDILVDLALHTAGNRMLVFARKPAPVQVTMLGLPATTGLATMDYRLTDPYLDPPGTGEDAYTERSIRLPHCFWFHEPSADAPAVNALPAMTAGHVTFGCLNQFAKVTGPVLDLWVKVLQALPGSRLVLQSDPGTHQQSVRARFEQGGIASGRITFVPRASRATYFERYHELDLCLDPFPYNGHTTTLDALWMGVSVVTLAGRTAVGRGGLSILSNVGLPELVAQSTEQYVEITVRLARDRERLAELRRGLRTRMLASPLTDGKGYTAAVEATFRVMWERWCGS
jgi:predicted O-linked N-acetylglucosamine transferase (SPINDLY family)